MPDGSKVKNPPAIQKQQETRVQSLGQEDPLEERAWQPTPVFLPGESNGERSLIDLKESDTTEVT